MAKNYFFLFLLLFFALGTQAQNLSTTNKKAIKLFNEADELFRNRQFEPGMAKLKEAIEKDPQFADAYFKLGATYKLFGEAEPAKMYFKKGCEVQPNNVKYSSAYLTLAEYYYGDGQYDEAKPLFEKVLKLKPTSKAMLDQAENYVKRCDFAIEATKNPITFVPKLMPAQINSFYIHAYPVLTADKNTLIFSKRNGPLLTDDEDIVISVKENGQWTTPKSISDSINTQFNEGACTMSADGKTLVFVSCNRPGGVGSCDLYISYKQGAAWSKPINMGNKVNSASWDSEASISADGKTLYFSSERKGTLGKEDIWYTKKDEEGEWGIPVNMGAPINTKGREVSPFIHADGKTLFFSSTEHLGMGGFDIFKTVKKDSSTWTAPKNIGYPINTAANDASVFIAADNSIGFYSIYEKKDRKAPKILLYEFEVPKEIKSEFSNSYAQGKVYDSETKKPVHATINVTDLQSNTVLQSVESDAITGEYLIVLTEGNEYAFHIEAPNYLFKSQFLDYKTLKNIDPMHLDIYLDPVKSGKAVVLNNLFFASNSYTLEEKSKTELNKIVSFLKKNPKLKIEFGGHTDNVGADQANLVLSNKRAEAVYNFIVAQGISATRLKAKGYGETKPVASNDTEEGRQKNRRLEFVVIEK